LRSEENLRAWVEVIWGMVSSWYGLGGGGVGEDGGTYVAETYEDHVCNGTAGEESTADELAD